jgi:hypothetical protein
VGIEELLELCRGDLAKGKFAAKIGITNTMLNNLYTGKRRMGEKTVAGLVYNYPQYKDRILEVFLPQNRNNSNEITQL